MTAHRVTVQSKINPERTLSYTIDTPLSRAQLTKIAQALTNPVTEQYAVDSVLTPKYFSYVVEIGFHPGVTDNVANTVRQMIEDVLGKKVKDNTVFSSRFLFYEKDKPDLSTLHNPLIERASLWKKKDFRARAKPFVPRVVLSGRNTADEVDLHIDDDALTTLGKLGIQDKDGSRRGPLALAVEDLRHIRSHFDKLDRNPTDIELESIAQTWSEHCKHTIFNDPLDDIKEGIYKRYIRGATEKIRKAKGKNDFCVSVFKDNSGAITFDDEYLVTHKVETHNSPSALDPFGGAITGIVGVNRDTLGFGLGAKPIANMYGFCVGEPNDKRELFRDEKRTQKLLSPRRILEGVVQGINAGGNQSGIPTPLGFVAANSRFRGKPLVFAGTVGLIPRKSAGRKLHQKKACPGDLIVMMGGRVGLDGIHGATFSSEALSTGSPATAVQIGDPITQKKLSDALIREARDQDLYSSITDNGAGGLSCSVAEMAKECGGCEVDLDKVPLKYPGLSPWQVWISESQERMTLAVPKGKWRALKKIMDTHNVEATVIGKFTASGKCVVVSRGKKVMDLSLNFLHDGRMPRQQLSKKPKFRVGSKKEIIPKNSQELISTLKDPNIGSYETISKQYDYEVQALSVTKPLQGKGRVNATSGVMKPVAESQKGIVVSYGLGLIENGDDPYAMASRAIDEAIRSAVVAGGSLNHLAILDNFCWSAGNSPERLYELKEAARACFETAVAFGTPFISGKDSMFNDFKGFDKSGKALHIMAPPTLLISTLGVIPDASRAVTLDFKMFGDQLFVVGDEGKSAKENKRLYKTLERAIAKGLVASAIPILRGGTAVAIAKSAIAGNLGAKAHLVPGLVLVSVAPENVKTFKKIFHDEKCTKVGEVTNNEKLSVKGMKAIPLKTLTSAYRTPFKNL